MREVDKAVSIGGGRCTMIGLTRLSLVAMLLGLGGLRALAQEGDPGDKNEAKPPVVAAPDGVAGGADLRESMCLMIEAAARAHDLPVEFFARVIWQESRFQPGAVGPRTRSGDSAQGIAQFMPRTAAERGLLDPFDPVQALPKSAEFPTRAQRSVRKSWARRGRLQCGARPRARLARRHPHLAG
jgi:hypothetical protein